MADQDDIYDEDEGTHPLFHAIQDEDMDAIKFIMEAEPSAFSLFYTNWDGTPLIYAITDGKFAEALYIIEHGPEQDWDFETPMGTRNFGRSWSAMEAACTVKRPEIVEALVKRGADPAKINEDWGCTSLNMVLRSYHDDVANDAENVEKIVAFLLTFPSVRANFHNLWKDVEEDPDVSVLGEACTSVCPPSIIKRLLDAGVDATFPGGPGSPLKCMGLPYWEGWWTPARRATAMELRDLIQASIDESIKARLLYRVRRAVDAVKVSLISADIARKQGMSPDEERRQTLDATPAFLRKRVQDSRRMPRVVYGPSVIPRDSSPETKVVEGERAGVLRMAAEELPDELFTQLMEMMVPPGDFARRGEELGAFLERAET